MKKQTVSLFKMAWLMVSLTAVAFISSCGGDDPDDEAEAPIASFQFEVDSENFLEVAFTNFSQNAVSYSWNFGDGNTSTDEDPVHTYAEADTYTVVLTATGEDGTTDTFEEDVTITDPNEATALLHGGSSKTWKLFREGQSMFCGPNIDNPTGWWGGLANDGTRSCLYTQTFTFTSDGEYIFDDMGSFWAEYLVFDGLDYYETCFDATAENMILSDAHGNMDVSAWLSGTHAYTYDPTNGTITLDGEGAWIGISKLGTAGEWGGTIQTSVTFQATIEEFTGYDLMTVHFDYAAQGAEGYWTFYYVSYSDPSLEPEIPTVLAPTANFSVAVDGLTVTLTNNSANADSYLWSFGDGTTSTEAAPSHTYASADGYTISLVSTGEGGEAASAQLALVGASVPAAADIQKSWSLRSGPFAVRVGDGPGNGNWWGNPQDWADAAPCLFDDTFTFGSDGSFVIDVQDEVYVEAGMTGITANACMAVANLPTELAGWGGGTFTHTFTDAAGDVKPMVTVTGTGAYIGFYKGYNGKELAQPEASGAITYTILSYVDGANADYMEVAVDIAAPGYWTYLMISE